MAIKVATKKCAHKFPNASSGNALFLLRTTALRSGIELKLGQLESFPKESQTGAVQSVRMTVETASEHLRGYREMVGLQSERVKLTYRVERQQTELDCTDLYLPSPRFSDLPSFAVAIDSSGWVSVVCYCEF